MGSRHRINGAVLAALLAASVAIGLTSPSIAVPPPSNPSDAELADRRQDVEVKAGRVGELANQLAAVEAELIRMISEVELALEDANRAQADQEIAERAAASAQSAAELALAESRAAQRNITQARLRLDEFAAGSYRQGSTIGSLTAFLGSSSPGDVLERAQLLDAVGGSELDALDELRRARIDRANKESTARATLAEARRTRARADEARVAAEVARDTAVAARDNQRHKAAEIEARREDTERQLVAARAGVAGLEAQRAAYQAWKAEQEREQAAMAAAALAQVQAAAHGGAASLEGGPAAGAPSAAGTVERVIARAMSQLGMPYAWGGGNAEGPTRGIRDGGVADSFGDYKKIGFDCSGLMIYAFAGAGVSLPHYSGYQARMGRQVSLSAKRPGDLLFWATGGRIHHVALYIGRERMIEAPYSGARVRISPVRYGGIVPHATRLL